MIASGCFQSPFEQLAVNVRKGGREAEGSRLLSDCRGLNLYRGFESLPFRHLCDSWMARSDGNDIVT